MQIKHIWIIGSGAWGTAIGIQMCKPKQSKFISGYHWNLKRCTGRNRQLSQLFQDRKRIGFWVHAAVRSKLAILMRLTSKETSSPLAEHGREFTFEENSHLNLESSLSHLDFKKNQHFGWFSHFPSTMDFWSSGIPSSDSLIRESPIEDHRRSRSQETQLAYHQIRRASDRKSPSESIWVAQSRSSPRTRSQSIWVGWNIAVVRHGRLKEPPGAGECIGVSEYPLVN